MKPQYLFFAVLVSVFFQSPVFGGDKIYASSLEGLCQKDGQGKYDLIAKELGITYKVYPAARARQFMLTEKSCLFPVDMQYFDVGVSLIQSQAFVKIPIKIFSLSKAMMLEELKGKRVGMRLGLLYGKSVDQLKKDWNVEYVDTLAQNMKKLESGRLDAIVEFELDVDEYFKKNPKIKNWQDNSKPIEILSDALVCVDTEKNRKVIDRFNKTINKNRKKIDLMLLSK